MGYNPSATGTAFKGSARSAASNYQNGTGSTMPIATPVAVNGSSQLILVDVSSEASVLAMVGYTAIAIPSAAIGSVASNGRLENVTTGFAVGSPLWVGNTPGSLTNVQPDLTVSGWATGDFVIFVGIVVQNEFNPANQDIQLSTQIIGQL